MSWLRFPKYLCRGDVVDVLVALLEHDPLPVGVCCHLVVGRAAGNRLDCGIEALEGLGRLIGNPAVIMGRPVADLPRAVHLVAEAPHLHAMRLLVAVGAA